MSEMNRFYQMGEEAADVTLVVNTACPSVRQLKDADEEKKKISVMQIYYLALIAYRQLKPEELAEFSANQSMLLEKYLKK